MLLGIEHGSITSEEVASFAQREHQGLDPQALAALPALYRFQGARKAFNQSYIDCTPEPGKPRSLLPPHWGKITKLLAESRKLAALTGPFQEQSKKVLETDANIADVKQLIDEHYEIARQEVKYLKAKSTSWLLASEKKSVDSEQLAALQHAISETIKSLSEYPDLQKKYRALLKKSEPLVVTQKTPEELEALYQPELSKRHPTQIPESFFERHRDALGFVAQASMLGSTFLRPAPIGDSKERSIAARMNALREQQWQTRFQEDLGEMSVALGLKANIAEVCYDLERHTQDLMHSMEEARPALQAYQALDPEIARDYGNKHVNLEMQANLVEALQLSDVVVPRPYGVRTQQVHDLLQTRAPEVYAKWDELGKAFETHQGPEAFLQTKLAQKLLAEIDLGIQKAFSNLIELPTDMRSWLQDLKKKNRYLMVRSTGAEDSKENANAGGNLSEAYVEPSVQAVSTAIGNVVRSYFAARSLENRINAGRNPFTEELRLAVTTQELIGEPVGGAKDLKDIPRSLVLFSNEPLFVNGEEFRVMRLSATYGHGEGVVGNQGIGTDTVMIIHSLVHPDQLQIFYENHLKPTRLTPVRDSKTGKVNLQPIANSPELAQARVFDNEEISRLFQWGLIGESYFGGPTDMEIVVLGDKIYPVQGRPVNRPELLPTYLDLAGKNSPVEASLRVDPMVSGKGSVVEITEAEQVLTASTLEEAERKFDKNKHRLVIVSQKEPSNSHPVVNFSSMGMPCLYIAPERMGDVDAWLKQMPQKSVAVCIQSGSMHLWDTSKGRIEDFRANGYVAHPAQLTPSFELKEPIIQGAALIPPRELEDLILATNMAATPEEALTNLKKLREHAWVTELTQGRAALEFKLSQMVHVPVEAQRILDAIKQLETVLEQTFKEAELAVSQNKGRLRALLQTKILSMLLFGDVTESLNQLSVARLKSSLKVAEEIVAYQKQLTHPARFADILLEGQRTPNPDIYSMWKEFLLKLESLPEAQTRSFREMMLNLNKANELAMWMTMFFPEGYELGTPVKTLQHFEKQFPESDKVPVQDMIVQLEQIRQLRVQLADFGEPEKFEARFKSLVEQAQALSSQHLSATAGGEVLNTVPLRMMDELVDLYDSAIKSMKMGHYSDQEKAERFKRMLLPYTELMTDWVGNLVGTKGFGELPNQIPLREYLDWTTRNLARCGAIPEQLHASGEFNVAAARVGSGALFVRHHPETLEDFFTLSHQNLLAVIGHLLNQRDFLGSLKGDALKPFKGLAEAIGKYNFGEKSKFKAMPIGTHVTEENISIEYRIPLRDHAAGLVVIYDKNTDRVSMKGVFLGYTEVARWEQIAVLLEASQFAEGPRLIGPIRISGVGLEFTEEVKPEQIKSALDGFSDFIKISFFVSNEEIFEKVFKMLEQTSPEEQVTFAKKYVSSTSYVSQKFGLEMFDKLVDKDQGVAEGIAAAQAGIASPDMFAQRQALKLFGKLIEKKQRF